MNIIGNYIIPDTKTFFLLGINERYTFRVVFINSRHMHILQFKLLVMSLWRHHIIIHWYMFLVCVCFVNWGVTSEFIFQNFKVDFLENYKILNKLLHDNNKLTNANPAVQICFYMCFLIIWVKFQAVHNSRHCFHVSQIVNYIKKKKKKHERAYRSCWCPSMAFKTAQ